MEAESRVSLVVRGAILVAVAALSLAGCGAGKPTSLEEIAARALSYTHTDAKDSVVDGVNDFALGLYANLAGSDEGNIFFSPFSISTALAMTYAGAGGATATQMADALRFQLQQEELPAAYGALLADMDAVGARDGYELDTANRLWGQKDFGFREEFLNTLEASYGAPLEEADFVSASEQARTDINGWVAEQTRDKIQDLLAEGSLDSTTRLVLVNALYFKGTWARTFKDRDTRDEPFTLPDGTPVTVPMMHQAAELNYMDNDLAKVLELPYTTGDLSMVFVLPQSPYTLSDVEDALTLEELDLWLAELAPVSELEVAIPRFSFTDSFALAQALEAMGMTDAFSGEADFSGMTEAAALAISEVFHKAFILVNEEGTEAAAATAVVVGETSIGLSFIADHPFLFFIRHNLSGAILFFGRVTDPRSS